MDLKNFKSLLEKLREVGGLKDSQRMEAGTKLMMFLRVAAGNTVRHSSSDFFVIFAIASVLLMAVTSPVLLVAKNGEIGVEM